jgi:hypothetical protein
LAKCARAASGEAAGIWLTLLDVMLLSRSGTTESLCARRPADGQPRSAEPRSRRIAAMLVEMPQCRYTIAGAGRLG